MGWKELDREGQEALVAESSRLYCAVWRLKAADLAPAVNTPATSSPPNKAWKLQVERGGKSASQTFVSLLSLGCIEGCFGSYCE